MSFSKGTWAGFATGFAVALVVAHIRVPRPGFLISADKKEHLTKKEAAARLNDALEDREMLFDIFLEPGKDPVGLLENIRLKAMTDPRWMKLLVMYERKGHL